MIKILFFDRSLLNSKVIEQDCIAFFNRKNIEYSFFEADTCEEALAIVNKDTPQIAFIDISSKEFNALELIKNINALNIKDLKIVGVTTLYDKQFRYEALRHKVYDFIYKPFDYIEIQRILEKYIDIKEAKKQTQIETDMEDEEFDEFMDFDEDAIDHDKNMMDDFNKSHKKVSAEEFLSLYEEEEFNMENLQDLEEDLDKLFSMLLFENDIKYNIDAIVDILEQYRSFLFGFSEFEELNNVLYALIGILENIDFSTLDKPHIISKFIVAIISDLVEWKDHVFIEKDAVDVYYINASILSSYMQLKDLLEN